jgi:SAM-dependent methyltransferase
MTATRVLLGEGRLRRAASQLTPAYRWVCSKDAVRRRMAPWLADVAVDDFSPTGRGLGPDDGLDRLQRDGHLRDATVVILGVGRGPEVERSWLDRGAAHVVGADLFAYPDDWAVVSESARQRGVAADFSLMDGSMLGLRDACVDVVFSQSVLEHVLDLDGFLAESARVLSDNGRFYAYFGPLWTTYGGPHVGALAYDHLLVDDEEYLDAARQVGDGWEHWLEAGLFNRLTFDQYLEALEAHFVIDRLGVVASRDGAAFRYQHPHVWAQLLERYDEKDLLINLVSVIARPRR